MAGQPIVIDRVQLRRSQTPSYRPPVNGPRALREGEAFFNVADSVLCIGTGLGPFVEFNLNLGGPPGPDGPEGPQGLPGPVGPIGPQGLLGPSGPQGSPGVQGVQGPRGLDGPVGPAGPVGPQGAGVTIKGSRTSPSALPTTGNTPGDVYIMSSAGSGYADGDGYTYTGSGTDAGPGGNWKNVGPIRGPQGVQGPTGPIGTQGAQGPQGLQGAAGVQGPQGLQGPTGAPGAQGPQGTPTTVNGKTGSSITLSAADVSAVPTAGPAVPAADISVKVLAGAFWTSAATKAKGWPEDTNSYAHLITSSYSASGDYYALQFSGGFFDNDNIYAIKVIADGQTAWRKLWHDGNFDAPAPTDAEFTAGTSTTKRPTVKQVADFGLALTSGAVPAAYAPRRGQFFKALKQSGADRVSALTSAVPSDPNDDINIAFVHTTRVTQAGTLAQFVKTTHGLTDAQLAAIIAAARTATE